MIRLSCGIGAAVVAFAACHARPQATTPPLDVTIAAHSEPKEPAARGETPSQQTGWLRVSGSRIVAPDGNPFRGRGANLNDTRSCDSCSWQPPHVAEVTRRIDALVDDWHATFIRLLLESYPDASTGRVHYKNILEDENYFRDILRIVDHVGKKRGVYLLLSLWHDPTFSPLGWPTERTRTVWKKLARALREVPFVMFGLVNEPQDNRDGKLDSEVWTAMNETVLAIRSVEVPGKPHIITVQGTREWGRVLDYYLAHPITAAGGTNIAYETHIYDRSTRFHELVARPSGKLPVVIGEMGIVSDAGKVMTAEDTVALMDLAESLDIPWLAYTFHSNCPPNLLVENAGTCALGTPLEPSPWGRIVKERLARPW